jgi:hypothetical protein
MYRARRPESEREVPLVGRAPEEPGPDRVSMPRQPLSPGHVLALQSYAGNAFVSRMLNRKPDATTPATDDSGAAAPDSKLAGKKEMVRMALRRALVDLYEPRPFAVALTTTPRTGEDIGRLASAAGEGRRLLEGAKTFLDMAARYRSELGLEAKLAAVERYRSQLELGYRSGLSLEPVSDADRRIDEALEQLRFEVIPRLHGWLATLQGNLDVEGGKTYDRLHELLKELRTQMPLAGLGEPTPPATPPPRTPARPSAPAPARPTGVGLGGRGAPARPSAPAPARPTGIALGGRGAAKRT